MWNTFSILTFLWISIDLKSRFLQTFTSDFVSRMDSSQLVTLTSLWGSTIRSPRSPQMARDYRWLKLHLLYLSGSGTVLHWWTFYVAGDRLLCHSALVRSKEALREDHAFPYMGGSERRRFCAGNRPSCGGASQTKNRQAVGETGQEPHQGTQF